LRLSRIQTRWYRTDTPEALEEALTEGARLLYNGGLVAFPTETVYGLGAHSFRPQAIRKIFQVKGRPPDNPLIVHLAHPRDMCLVAEDIPTEAYQLAENFWPGPLTLVLKKRKEMLSQLSGGLSTVAVRIPAHPLALELLKKLNAPVSAPSANLSGNPSPTRAEHVWEDLGGKIEAILDGGDAQVGLESTVLALHTRAPVLLRPGGITREELEDYLRKKITIPESNEHEHGETSSTPLSPGMKYRHYAPRAPLYLFLGTPHQIEKNVKEYIKNYREQNLKVGVICSEELAHTLSQKSISSGTIIEVLGSRRFPSQLAATLFAAMRRLDEQGAEVILAEGYSEKGMGLALMNRLKKAAKEIIK